MPYVYILHSEASGQYYIGYTKNLLQRITDHQNDQGGWTQGKGPWALSYYEEYDDDTEARKREIQLKRNRKRTYLEWLFDHGPGNKTV
jgi:putative endonuclease